MHCYSLEQEPVSQDSFHCSVSDGSAANSAACACGSVDCESASTTGMHCYLSKNQCSQASPHLLCVRRICWPTLQPVLAAVWIASLPAPLACFAGSQRTDAASTPTCSVTDGSAANSAACACGSVDCESPSTTGMHCYLSKNQCRKIPTCSVSDGSAANSEACACGSVDCESASTTGMFCRQSENRCSRCLPTAQCQTDLLPTLPACACGSVDCECHGSSQLHWHALDCLEQPTSVQDSPPALCPTDLLPTLQPVLAAVWIASLPAPLACTAT